MYQTMPVTHRMSNLSLKDSDFKSRYMDSYGLYEEANEQQHRRRLSSTGEGSGESTTTTTSAGSYVSEKEDAISEGVAESEHSGSCGTAPDEIHEEEGPSRSPSPSDGIVNELEREQVEYSFKGLQTKVFVSSCLANLYTKSTTDEDWQIKFTGIPVVVLDIGEARSRNKRRIQMILAERGTSFMLWRDTIDNLSSYTVSSPTFHTMFYSADHTLQVGFSFDHEDAATSMWKYIENLISDPENISLSTPGKKKKKKKVERKSSKPAPLPPKTQISLPCCFLHVTQVEHQDRSKYFSLKELVPKSAFDSKTYSREST